jgi:NAD(P)-dependent dehydrogenase (short-subunit alcohol dehydrogenase family)
MRVVTDGHVASVGARALGAGPADYNGSKAALSAITKVTSEQFGAKGVRAVTVSPGAVGPPDASPPPKRSRGASRSSPRPPTSPATSTSSTAE